MYVGADCMSPNQETVEESNPGRVETVGYVGSAQVQYAEAR